MKNNHVRNNNFQMKYLNECERINGNLLSTILSLSYENKVSTEILFGIIVLERLNRGDLITRIIEYLSAKTIPFYLELIDASVGIGQVKISTARKVLGKKEVREVLKVLLNQKESIDLVAKIIKGYLLRIGQEKDFNSIIIKVSNLYITGKENPRPNPEIILNASLLKWSVTNQLFKETYHSS